MFGTADDMSLLLPPAVTIPLVDIVGTNEPKVGGLRRLDLLMGVVSIKHRVEEEEDDLLYHTPPLIHIILPTDLLLKANTLLTVLNLCILIYTGITCRFVWRIRGVEMKNELPRGEMGKSSEIHYLAKKRYEDLLDTLHTMLY